MKTLLWLIRKDLLVFFSDRNGALLTIVVPVALASLLGMLFAPREKAATIDLLVADRDGGANVAALVEALDADEALRVERVTEEVARRRVMAGDAPVALVIPAGSSALLRPANLFAGEQGHVDLLYDPSKAIEASLAGGLVLKNQMQQAAKGFTDPTAVKDLFVELKTAMRGPRPVGVGGRSSEWIGVLDQAIALVDEDVAAAGADGGAEDAGDGVGKSDGEGGMRAPLAVHKEALTAAGPGTGYNSYAHTFAGMLCMFLLFLGQDSAKNLLAEHRQGTLARLRVSRASQRQILGALALSTSALALVVTVAVYGVGFLVFDIEVLGSWVGFVALLVAQALFVGAFALLLAGLFRSEKQVTSVGSALILAMSFLGGAWFPTFLMPEWLQAGAVAIPTHWATQGLAAVTWRGLPLADALLPTGALLAFAAVAAGIGAWRFHWD